MYRNGILTLLIFCSTFFILNGCSGYRLKTVKPELYGSLPQNVREDSLKGRGSELRVVDGKIAKVKTDIQEQQLQIRKSYDEIQAKREDINAGKKFVRELRKKGAQPHEINAAKKDINLAEHRWKIAQRTYRYELQKKVILKRQLEVFEWEKKALLSRIEWDKMQSVHEYTNYGVPDIEVQVAKFKTQYKRFKLQESQAQYDLSKAELRAKEEQKKIYVLEKGDQKDPPKGPSSSPSARRTYDRSKPSG